jgi:phosphomannomutase
MSDLNAVFKAYDIRGLVPEQLDADDCAAIGAAFATFVRDDDGSRAVVVGRDMRPSGTELVDAFASGVMGQGLDVIDIGLASTDMLYFASGELDMPGAMFTASHNPAGYNGIKLCRRAAGPVGQESGLTTVRDLAADPPAPVADRADRGERREQDLLGAFADHVRSFVDVDRLAPLRIVADTANGMGGLVAPAVFEGLPFEVEFLYPELDGTFPNHPADPIQPENQRDLQARVLETGADIGLAFDGDADRVFLVDEAGELLPGSLTTAIVAKGILTREPGATIIHNLICSKAVPEVVVENGGTPVRTRVGHSFIKQVMAETGAAFGGEHSGHYYFRDNFRADSGLIASLLVLEQLSEAGVPLSELRKPFERFAASGELNTTVDDQQAVLERVAAEFVEADQDRLDGLTVDLGDWWFNLRPSNTEPLLRLNLEADDPVAVQRHVTEIQALMRGD